MANDNKPTVASGDVSDPQALHKVKANVHRRLLEILDLVEANRMSVEELRTECSRRVDQLLNEQRCPLSAPEKRRLVQDVIDDIFGLGPLEDLLRDPAISDILVNGPQKVYVEREGRLQRTDLSFRDDAHVMLVIQRIAIKVGRRIDESSPMLDARLLDGSRVNAIIPPLSLSGPCLSIRRFGTIPIDTNELLRYESVTEEMLMFLQACVQCKVNILISGGTGAGKTTMLNVLAKAIPASERIITIEDAAELRLPHEHVITLEARPPNIEGRGEVTPRDLLRNCLRMRPDRIVIGEVRGAEALDMLQAMNTGHEGSMTTVHANNPRDALRRIENMVSMAGLNYPVDVIRHQIASALHVLLHVARLTGGRRKIVSLAEITGIESGTILLHDLFTFTQRGVDAQGHAKGEFERRGVRPQLLERLEAAGVTLPPEIFMRDMKAMRR
ncbi:MAG TPA: CpaF family protein [Phycisphaerae bacterium]|nr:CpaF family protein [Phycisphaerae bacterium]